MAWNKPCSDVVSEIEMTPILMIVSIAAAASAAAVVVVMHHRRSRQK